MMNKKRITLLIASIISAIILMAIPNKVNAALPSATNLYFGRSLVRENSGTILDEKNQGKDAGQNIGYALIDGTSNPRRTHAVIWDIKKYPNANANSTGVSGNYYCAREGKGFFETDNSGDTIDVKKMEYKNALDFKNKSNIKQIEDFDKLSDDDYYSLLALADIMYLEGDNLEEFFNNALKNISEEDRLKYNTDYPFILTESDVKAIQQATVWYFSNHDQTDKFNNIYDMTNKEAILYYTLGGVTTNDFNSLDSYDFVQTKDGKIGSGLFRHAQAKVVYKYLIETATNNAINYKNGTIKSNTNINVYTNLASQSNTQPIIAIERLPEEVKEFDLALRKYITKVDGVTLTGTDTRVPDIDKETIKTNKTATYKHRKDPVKVKTGSIVTYNLTVYNEGEKAGRATKIVDQLPEGLQFSKVNTSGFTANYNSTTNQVEIIRDASNTKNLEAYTENNFESETIELECIVTEKPDSKNQKILTNVAWIAEEYDAVDKVTITTETGKDRDSEPATAPNVNKDNMSNYIGNSSNKTDLIDSTYYYKGQQDDDDFEKLVIEPAVFDLKLVKRIVEVNGTKVPERIENVDITKLANGTATTADYKLNKDPVTVKKGDIVKYTLRIYNEGDIDGYASEITEDIPDGLEFIWSEKEGSELEADTILTKEEKEAITYNQGIWDIKTVNSETNKIELITTDYLAKGKGAEIATSGANLIKAFDASKEYKNTINDKNPDYKEVSVYLKVTAENSTKAVIRNEAAITEDSDSDGNTIDDRDSSTDKWVKYEDDEDYDNVILQSFDLALRKFIIAVSKDTSIEDTEYLKNSDGKYTRAPVVDTSKLNTVDENGKMITTATYNHTKEPLEVSKNDYVVYMLRVYNEGDLDGYASEIKDHLPPYLQYVDSDFNKTYGWKVSQDGRTVTTTYLENSKIDAAVRVIGGITADGLVEGFQPYILSYKEVPIMCKVTDDAKGKITNIADITEYKDENKKIIDDRDSKPDNVVLPSDEKLPEYKDDETGDYIPGQEDDDDFEKVVVKKFDLALRKFITGVNDDEITTRIPQVKYDKENNKITYEHTKDPVDVVTGDIVTYTIRVFNEGEIAGYASKVSDDIPNGLEYLPDNELNKEYRWIMYDSEGKETEDVTKAVKITTDYLSKEQGEARMKENSGIEENPALLTAFDNNKEISNTNPDYADVQVAFKVIELNESDKIIINSAQISDDTDKDGKPVDDEDSTPDEWIEGEDDQDREYIKLNYFDLALRKWVTQAIVIENGKETVTQTGHKAEDDPEDVVKVEIHRKKLSSVTVKFKYSIRVTNEGDIAGYAKEVTDYVPEGLKFVAQDNPDWKDEGNNVISTRKLENTLLQPGESAEVEVTLTWINGKDNMGLKTNIAEISEDYNDKHVHDRDSTPDNKKEGEDDIDDAPVLLSVSTGQVRIYFTLGFTILITIAGGVVLIKKFVL